jgi:hypothetical protein
LKLGRTEKLVELDRVLDAKLGESIGALGVIDGSEKQAEAVRYIEILLNTYHDPSDKEKALRNLEVLLNYDL